MNLQTLPISKLLGYNFNIPAYQRGYRWDNQQIFDLLDDLLEFSSSKKKETSYYCLQPIVVKENTDGTYDVIDGQQRLTTIYILLSYLYPVRRILQKSTCDKMFTIKYDKRDDGYLKENVFAHDTEEYKNDINKFFIHKAYEAIDCWFNTHTEDGDNDLTILETLLGKKGTETIGVAKVIWYDVSESSDSSIEIFTRLNYGKIPLTDAELIKALLLICDHYPDNVIDVRKETAMRMSSQWDEMENALHDTYLWSMISSSEHKTDSRIGLLINKVVRDIKRQSDIEQKEILGDDFVSLYDFSEDKDNFDYHIANRYLELNGRTAAAVDSFWQKIQDAFTVVRNWSSDRVVYHYIGYLSYITEWSERDKRKKAKKVNAFIDKCFEKYLNPTTSKKDFVNYLRSQIAEEIKVCNLGQLSYAEANDKRSLIKILLLFNVEQAIRYSSERLLYPFSLQKKQNITSLEHIHPQNLDTEFNNNEDDYKKIVLPWLKSKERHLTGDDKELCKKYQTYDIFNKNFSDVKAFIQRIDEHFKDMAKLSEEEMHTIRNMAIVSKEVNSALSNGFMAEKRVILGEHEKSGDYIPLATWMVFNKSLTNNPVNLTFWEKEDREAYYEAIRSTYLNFVTKHVDDEYKFNNKILAVKESDKSENVFVPFALVTDNKGNKIFIDADCQTIKIKDGWLHVCKKGDDTDWLYNDMNDKGELKSEDWSKQNDN